MVEGRAGESPQCHYACRAVFTLFNGNTFTRPIKKRISISLCLNFPTKVVLWREENSKTQKWCQRSISFHLFQNKCWKHRPLAIDRCQVYNRRTMAVDHGYVAMAVVDYTLCDEYELRTKFCPTLRCGCVKSSILYSLLISKD